MIVKIFTFCWICLEMTQIYFGKFSSPIGIIKVARTAKGICFVWLNQNQCSDFKEIIEKKFGSIPVEDNTCLKKVEDDFQRYFDGSLKKFSLPLDVSVGTPFQKKVWKLLLKIPFGQVRSYKWVAEQIGRPNASRAVGNANGRNPIPIIIPCHRVIESNGGLGGYSSGIETKKKLLIHEGIQF